MVEALALRRWALAALLALTLLRLTLAAILPLTPDESYYFLWAQHLQPGYYDHPPMVALWIKAGTLLAGNNALGTRLLGPLSAALGSVLLWDMAERLAPGRGLTAALLLNATLMIGVGAIIITPDTPLLFFWIAGAAICVRLIEDDRPLWWLALGLAAGGMLLSKYTALLFIVAVFLWLLTSKDGRWRLATPWPWAATVLALAVFAPNIAWNAAHGWISYVKQGGRETHFDPGRAAQYFAELMVGQAFLATPFIAGLAVAGLWHVRRDTAPGPRLLLWLSLVPGAVMLAHVLSGRVQGNWVVILYPSTCVAAALLPAPMLQRWRRIALGVGFGVTALAYIQALAAPIQLPARLDTAGDQLAGWRALAEDAMAGHPAFVTTDDYATMAVLAVQGPPGVKVVGFYADWLPRWGFFGYPPAVTPGEVGVLITRHTDSPCAQQLGTVTRHRGAKIFATYRLCSFKAPDSGVLLPRP
ncbi:MAG TPA: glycosyltransferase family 39 protein [Acidocella sp.]|nr:glycosyltransferase family 39 protein [Acidocella sp.]